MRIIQLLPTISYGDAVGNDTLAIKTILQEMGFETAIYAENIDTRLPNGTAQNVSELTDLSNDDIIIYHASTGTELNYKLPELNGHKIMIYHNITPSAFFTPYSSVAEQLTQYGLESMKYLANKIDYCIADSEYNKKDLQNMEYTCPIDVCPILIPFEDYAQKPNPKIIRQYINDDYINLLFVGRIAPNKKQEDIIRAFYYYHKYYNSRSRLILVGSWGGMEKYYNCLHDYTKSLELDDVVYFTGHIKFDEILAYYTIADAFICMSEHEGFCVPLVEAMCFNLPIIAYNSSAISSTLGDSGFLLHSKEPKLVAAVIDQTMSNGTLKQDIIDKQKKRLADFGYELVRKKFERLLKNFLAKEGLS